MEDRLLRTKLHVPRPRNGLVVRESLDDRLNRGRRSRLTLLSAPPGFGKSTLLADWLSRARDVRAAWVSLDAADSDVSTFWMYVVAAVVSVLPDIATAVGHATDAQALRPETVVRALVNGLTDTAGEVVVVLDDYHVIDRAEVHESVALLIERLPANAHLVVATRADPPLALSRLRAQGELTEIRAADLRFSPAEAGTYLRATMGLDVSDEDVAALEARTEGWISALQLAAISMQARDDLSAFIADFRGTDRYVVDYLVDEVLERQSPEVRAFLLHTSILDRLTGRLCDAVTGRDNSRAMLEALERANLLLVPLDDQRRWYRYHHLFGDVLRARLLDEQPEVAPALHGRASRWYEANGAWTEAIQHALAAKNVERAADLIELAIPAMRQSRSEVSFRRWLDALPDHVVSARPVLSTGAVGVLLSTGEFERASGLLDAVERWLALPAGERVAAGMVVVDNAEFERLPGAVALYRTAQLSASGDVSGAIEQARRVLEVTSSDDVIARGAAAAFLGLLLWTSGDLESAYRSFSHGMATMRRAGHLADVVNGTVTRAEIRIAQGRLSEALAILEDGLRLGMASGRPLRGTANVHVAIAAVLAERDDLGAAASHLALGAELGEDAAFPRYGFRAALVRARLALAGGDANDALRHLDVAQDAYVGEFSPDVTPVAALKARLAIARGDLARARAWASDIGLTAADTTSYLHEFEHATLARLLGATGRDTGPGAHHREATGLLARLLEAAESAGRTGSVIDLLIAIAVVRHGSGDDRSAFVALDGAVALAEPQGFVRSFLDEGPPMVSLLKAATRRRDAPRYERQLLERAAAHAVPTPGAQQPIEPLSERELEVLRLLRSELDGPGIARELGVGLSTIRTHTKNIYGKLGVNSRRAAVRRAEELRLV